MKVLDLQCGHGHSFEGWFASEQDFEDQKHNGMLQCPLCSDTGITKKLSAPRLNLGAREPVAKQAADKGGSQTQAPSQAVAQLPAKAQLQAAWLAMAREVLAHTEDVGERFAEEARKMHYGETTERGIRGQATAAQTMELLEEGIAVLPIALPSVLKETLQ